MSLYIGTGWYVEVNVTLLYVLYVVHNHPATPLVATNQHNTTLRSTTAGCVTAHLKYGHDGTVGHHALQVEHQGVQGQPPYLGVGMLAHYSLPHHSRVELVHSAGSDPSSPKKIRGRQDKRICTKKKATGAAAAAGVSNAPGRDSRQREEGGGGEYMLLWS